MRNVVILAVAVVIAALYFYPRTDSSPRRETSVYEFNVTDIDNNQVKMGDYKGKVLLITNVA
jgi:hypothetical protein